MPAKPSRSDLEAARDRTIPDVLPEPGSTPDGTPGTVPFEVLFCGINPSLYSAATGWHFARPGNRFWPALHLAGFTSRQLAPSEQHLLAAKGIGITNLVARATAQASELTGAELRRGGERLTGLVRERRPAIVAILGVTAYRSSFGDKNAQVGMRQRTLAGAKLWILPNPSGLNAHWTLETIAAEFKALRGGR